MIPEGATIARIWRGWATVEKADAYEKVVRDEVLPGIFARDIPGLIGAHLMRAVEPRDGEIEFTTVMWFDRLSSVENFMGAEYRRSHVPASAQAVLERFDAEAIHLDLIGYFGA